jgi:hypothetical protein
MSEARTIWDDLAVRRSTAANRRISGVVIAAVLLALMAVAEVAFLRYVAGPDSVSLISAAEGIPTD